jgi:putative intracellular protease/amidase
MREHGGRYRAAGRFKPHVVVDGRLVTGQNPASSRGLAAEVVRLLAGP